MANKHKDLRDLFTDLANAIKGITKETNSIAATDIPSIIREKLQAIQIKPYIKFSSPNPFSISMANSTIGWDGTIQYSTDKEIWEDWDSSEIHSALVRDSYVLYMRGIECHCFNFIQTSNNNLVITGTDVRCDGNIEALIDYTTVEEGDHPEMYPYCFAYMFKNCTALIKAPELPAIYLTDLCYTYMFQGCTNLTQAPVLPATELRGECYKGMFYGCTSLTQAPELPARSAFGAEYCYAFMFQGCTSLIQVPKLSLEDTSRYCCADMFYGCTSLTQIPTKLFPHWLEEGCYRSMFYGCTSLTKVPSIPADGVSSSSCAYMFYNCINLIEIPTLYTSSLDFASNCYAYMFKGCKKIKLSSYRQTGYTTPYQLNISSYQNETNDYTTGMFDNTGGPFTGGLAFNRPYYISDTNTIVQ